ncbi:DUF2165 family protein [Vibrio aestuarianus]|uniref:DUF2165 family protein n=1 Tax=Vibrio aestuarianus TaxID=28171 RepID=UPI00237CC5DC|nr:DUF2165 family protein [Vibrio aestuarianus]MDE1330414.1 DUF2165 domain-containing protein [Vibrio aestuarianus]
MKSANLPKLFYLTIFTIWMTLITVNNINDSGTNTLFIKQVVSMSLFEKGSGIGDGLLWRAIDFDKLASYLIDCVILLELLIDILMWATIYNLIKDIFNSGNLSTKTINLFNYAICAWMSLFGGFICIGMWFGYWMHHGAFQMVHITGLIVGGLGYLIFNITDQNKK